MGRILITSAQVLWKHAQRAYQESTGNGANHRQ